jgi:hypothetical protein
VVRLIDGASSATKPEFKYVTHTRPEFPERCVACRTQLAVAGGSVLTHKRSRQLTMDEPEETLEKHFKLTAADDDDLRLLASGQAAGAAGAVTGFRVENLWPPRVPKSAFSPADSASWSQLSPSLSVSAATEVCETCGSKDMS